MTPPGRPDAILFDWDSTLVDNWAAVARALNATLARAGLPQWSEAEVRRRAKNSARDAFPDLFGEGWRDALDFFYARFAEFHLDGARPLPGAARLLETLRAHGVPASVVSNKSGPYLRAEAETLGWSGLFVRLVGAGDAARDKPSPDPVRLALEGTGAAAGEGVWLVGDSAIDMQCAHLASCVPILVEGGTAAPEELEAWPPRRVFPDLAALERAFLECAPARRPRDRTGNKNKKGSQSP